MKLGRVGVIGRFKPLHNGGALMLDAICENADHVVIGLGSSNKYNLRNPFTGDESAGMIEAYLSPRFSNYELIHVPDFGHIQEFSDGKKWKEYGIILRWKIWCGAQKIQKKRNFDIRVI